MIRKGDAVPPVLLDALNAAFQAAGAVAAWNNTRALWRDKAAQGVRVSSVAFFAVWGVWNVYYFAELGQWLSVVTGGLLAAANVAWVALAAWLRSQPSAGAA